MNSTLLALSLSGRALFQKVGRGLIGVGRFLGWIFKLLPHLVVMLVVMALSFASILETLIIGGHVASIGFLRVPWEKAPFLMAAGHVVVWGAVVWVGGKKGAFQSAGLWWEWPTKPDATGKEAGYGVALGWWLLVSIALGPLLVFLLFYGIFRLVRAIPARFRAHRDAILEANPEARARLERAHLGRLLKGTTTHSRTRRL